MADQTAIGEEFERKAEKKLKGWGSSKLVDAADLYVKAASCYELANNWDKAGAAYTKAANCHLKDNFLKYFGKRNAASAYVNAAKCYKKISAQDASQSLNQAVNLYFELGEPDLATRYLEELGDIYELCANQCKKEVAQFAAEQKQYPKAIEKFEEMARHSINSSFLKYDVKGILLDAGICEICKGDFVAISNALERYQVLDPTFSGTREYKLLADLAASMDKEDVMKFTEAIKKFENKTRLDSWETTLLRRAKIALKAKADKEADLT